MGVQWKLTGTWSPYRGVQRRSFESDYPIESTKDLWQAYRGTSYGSWSGLGVETNGRMFVRDVEYFFLAIGFFSRTMSVLITGRATCESVSVSPWPGKCLATAMMPLFCKPLTY